MYPMSAMLSNCIAKGTQEEQAQPTVFFYPPRSSVRRLTLPAHTSLSLSLDTPYKK